MYAHRNGQWAKKIKTRFFGKWEDPDAALQSFVEQRDDILAGRDRKRWRSVCKTDLLRGGRIGEEDGPSAASP